ncbi:MAG: hypothetical protein ACREPR_15400 [Brasilonema sp.]
MMTKSKNILSTVFSVSLLVLPLLVVQADGQRAARAEETGTTSSPVTGSTIIFYCNRTSRSINATIRGLNWKTLRPGDCDTITFDKGYKGMMSFYVDASGNRPFSREEVGAGKYCFEYTDRSNRLNFTRTSCPKNL